MEPTQRNKIRNLRESAEHCRALAGHALPFETIQELEAFAAELEGDALRLERLLRPVEVVSIRRRANIGTGAVRSAKPVHKQRPKALRSRA